MKSNIILFLLSFAFIVSCGDNESDKNSIEFWHFWSEPYQRTVIDSLVNEFEKEYKVEVEVTELSWNDGKMKLQAAFNSKTAPDVLELGSDWVAQFSSAGVLEEFTSDDANLDNFIEYSTEPCYWNGKAYALPWIVDTRVMFVNAGLLKQNDISDVPKTYEELLEYSKVIHNPDNVYGFGLNGSDRHRLYKKIISFIWSNGGSIYEDKKFSLNSPKVIEAVKKYVALSEYGIVDDQKKLDNYFAQGKIGFWISGSWLLKKIDQYKKVEDLKLIEIPGINGNKGISFAGGEYLSISKNSENKELAKKFVKYMTNGKNAIEFCKKIPEAGFPADKEYYSKEFYDNEYKAIFAKQLESAKMTPVHPDWLEVERILESAVEKVLYNTMSVEEAMNEAQEKVEKL